LQIFDKRKECTGAIAPIFPSLYINSLVPTYDAGTTVSLTMFCSATLLRVFFQPSSWDLCNAKTIFGSYSGLLSCSADLGQNFAKLTRLKPSRFRNLCLPIHLLLQHSWNGDRAIRLLILLPDRHCDPRQSDTRSVDRVHELQLATVAGAVAQIAPTRLE